MTVSQEIKSPSSMKTPVPEEIILKVCKEIVVKFIEVGKVSPANFETTFNKVYETIEKRVQGIAND